MTAKKKVETNPKTLLELARAKAAVAPTWADFANYLFNPHNGLITSPFPTREDRRQFKETSEYEAIMALLREVQDRTGLVEGATPTEGKFVVSVPRSLYPALVEEAIHEGVSVDQLVAAKLSTKLAVSTEMASPMRSRAAV